MLQFKLIKGGLSGQTIEGTLLFICLMLHVLYFFHFFLDRNSKTYFKKLLSPLPTTCADTEHCSSFNLDPPYVTACENTIQCK